MQRNEKNVLENNVYSKLPTVSAGEYAKELSVYTDSAGNKAVVLKGWTVSGVLNENTIWGKDVKLIIYHIPEQKIRGINWKNQDEVEKLRRTYDQLRWIPVVLLTANSTLDGRHFNKKFGRINYWNEDFSCWPHEVVDRELAMQKESAEKYGGYYISRYDISKDEKTGKQRSVKDAEPWTYIYLPTAKEVATTMVESETATSHLTYEAEYDTFVKCMIETGTKNLKEISENSKKKDRAIYYTNEKYPCGVTQRGNDVGINRFYGFFAGNEGLALQQVGICSDDLDSPSYLKPIYDLVYVHDNRPYINYNFTGFLITIHIK